MIESFAALTKEHSWEIHSTFAACLKVLNVIRSLTCCLVEQNPTGDDLCVQA
jgi:hypothetical protein